jgi:hypothetical protein
MKRKPVKKKKGNLSDNGLISKINKELKRLSKKQNKND